MSGIDDFFEMFSDPPSREAPIDPQSDAGKAMAEQYIEHNARQIEHQAVVNGLQNEAARSYIDVAMAKAGMLETAQQVLPVLVCSLLLVAVAKAWRLVVGHG